MIVELLIACVASGFLTSVVTLYFTKRERDATVATRVSEAWSTYAQTFHLREQALQNDIAKLEEIVTSMRTERTELMATIATHERRIAKLESENQKLRAERDELRQQVDGGGT